MGSVCGDLTIYEKNPVLSNPNVPIMREPNGGALRKIPNHTTAHPTNAESVSGMAYIKNGTRRTTKYEVGHTRLLSTHKTPNHASVNQIRCAASYGL